MTTWSEIKQIVTAQAPDAIGSLIGTDGNPSQLAILAYLVCMKIAGQPHKFRSMVRLGSIAMNGSGSYDLAALFPDMQVPIQFYDSSKAEIGYRSLPEFNVTVGGYILTVRGKTLLISGEPSGSTLSVPYFSNYMVLDEDLATRKRMFENDGDNCTLYDDQIPMLIAGIMEHVNRREKELRPGQLSDFQQEIQNAILNDRPIERTMFDWRFLV